MSTNAQARERLDFVDIHRAIAVLLMLWMHSADGWLRPELKVLGTWDVVRGLGGLAAPTFLLLAGLSLGLGWTASGQGGRRLEVARGLSLVVLGYALRLQMWMIDAGGYKLPAAWAAAALLGLGYFAAYRALSMWGRGVPWAGSYGLGALSLCYAGLWVVAEQVPERLLPLLRVDVLQAIGASLAGLALLARPLTRWPALGLALGVAVGLLTPWVRAAVPGPLPLPLAGYLAQWAPPPGHSTFSLFPLFPWMAYAAIGTTLGLWLGRARQSGDARRLALRWAILGVLLALVCCEPLPLAHRLVEAQPWLLQLVRVGYRIGATLVLGGLALLLSHPKAPLRQSLVKLGQASLFVYWVHLQFAFGALAKPYARSLDFPSWALGLSALALLMTLLAHGYLYARRKTDPLWGSIGSAYNGRLA